MPAEPGCGDDTGPTPAAGEPKPDDFPMEGKTDPFELWLRRRLREDFGAVAGEPIPEDLLRLVEEDRADRERIRRQRRAESDPEG